MFIAKRRLTRHRKHERALPSGMVLHQNVTKHMHKTIEKMIDPIPTDICCLRHRRWTHHRKHERGLPSVMVLHQKGHKTHLVRIWRSVLIFIVAPGNFHSNGRSPSAVGRPIVLERKKCVCVCVCGGTTSSVNVDRPQPDKGITTRVAGERLDAAGVTDCKSVCIFAHGSAFTICGELCCFSCVHCVCACSIVQLDAVLS